MRPSHNSSSTHLLSQASEASGLSLSVCEKAASAAAPAQVSYQAPVDDAGDS